ncbi:histidine--tRNA ligase [Cardiobacteriaceae bacterium TAE3-ERU3]|nr:histidine--tRNA ligase [Cardiobacteriaceae bacterium TAE3-ERU3]
MSKIEPIQSLRGMRNILPPESSKLFILKQIIAETLQQFGYQPWEIPVLEKTALFKRSIGEETDVVSKEMYTFNDRNDESITLRPEATAGVVRTMIEEGLLQQPQRLYVEGPMFRYERPQKGRYRQFTQISVEAFGFDDPALDAELIFIGAKLFERLGFLDQVQLEYNTIGTLEERREYQKALVIYLRQHIESLDEDSVRRLETNPLRILDSKNPQVQKVLDDAPVLDDFLGEASQEHFSRVCALLDELGIAYQRNKRLVRGLDYYNHSVFEWTTDALGAQGTICAGGRYDALVEQLGGKPTPAAGFAFGIDRILLLAEQQGQIKPESVLAYGIALGVEQQAPMMDLCARLRQQLNMKVVFHPQNQSMKAQMKKADQSGAIFAMIMGDGERAEGVVTLKNLRTGEQTQHSEAGLVEVLQGVEND